MFSSSIVVIGVVVSGVVVEFVRDASVVVGVIVEVVTLALTSSVCSEREEAETETRKKS